MPEPSFSIDRPAIDKIVNRILRAWKAPGAAVAIICGDDAYLQGYGVKQIGKDDPITPDTLFAIASTTKAFTTTAMAMLVDEKKMAWDDHPRKHVPFFKLSDPVADYNVTFRDLLCHRTGMPRHDELWFTTDWSNEEIVRRYGLAPSKHPFRTTYEYTNICYEVAGLVIAQASDSNWSDFVRERIFKPLGMTGAKCNPIEGETSPDHAAAHMKNGSKIDIVRWYDEGNRDAACGGIAAGARDVSKWLQFQLNNGEFGGKRIVSKNNLLETRKPHIVVPMDIPDKYGFHWGTDMISYGLAWNIRSYRGHIVIDHGGSICGFNTNIAFIPREGIGIAIFTNISGTPAILDLRNSIWDKVLDLPQIGWTTQCKALAKAQNEEKKAKKSEDKRQTGTHISRKLEAYVGNYEDPAYGTVVITLEDGSLKLAYNRMSLKLKHYHFETFIGSFDDFWGKTDFKLSFNLDHRGDITALKMLAPFEMEFRHEAQE